MTILAGIGALTAFTLRRLSPRTLLIFATAALAAGTALSLVALTLGSLPAYLAATALTGMGFGTAFSGVVASLSPRIPATQRADTFAVIYLLAYLSFGIPTVLAGMLVGVVGLEAVCIGYGVGVIVLALVALVLRAAERALSRTSSRSRTRSMSEKPPRAVPQQTRSLCAHDTIAAIESGPTQNDPLRVAHVGSGHRCG